MLDNKNKAFVKEIKELSAIKDKNKLREIGDEALALYKREKKHLYLTKALKAYVLAKDKAGVVKVGDEHLKMHSDTAREIYALAEADEKIYSLLREEEKALMGVETKKDYLELCRRIRTKN